MKKQQQPDNTAAAIIIIILVFGCIMAFFSTHSGNSKDESVINCLLDGGAIEACFNQ